MLFLINSSIIQGLWMISGIIGFFLHRRFRDELQQCLDKRQLFHLFGGIFFSLFIAFIFGPLTWLIIYLLLKYMIKD